MAGELDKIIGKYIGNNANINIGAAAEKVHSILIENINSADIPAGAKSAILNAVGSPVVLSPTTAAINIGEVMRPSVYTLLGSASKYGNVDLVLIFNERSAVKRAYYPVAKSDKGKTIWAKMKGGWIKPYSNHFLENTVAQGNAYLSALGGYVTMV